MNFTNSGHGKLANYTGSHKNQFQMFKLQVSEREDKNFELQPHPSLLPTTRKACTDKCNSSKRLLLLLSMCLPTSNSLPLPILLSSTLHLWEAAALPIRTWAALSTLNNSNIIRYKNTNFPQRSNNFIRRIDFFRKKILSSISSFIVFEGKKEGENYREPKNVLF